MLNNLKSIRILLVCLIILSCSSDDSEQEENGNTNADGKQLQKIEQKDYSFDDGELERELVTLYENNKPVEQLGFDALGNLTGSGTFEYNTTGLLSREIGLSSQGILEYEELYAYDRNGRMVSKTNKEKGNEIKITFTYNDDNTITVKGEDDGEFTYVLNSNGLVEKEVSGFGTYTVVYDGNNPVTISRGDSDVVSKFFYEEKTSPKLSFSKALFGNNKANIVLWGSTIRNHASSNANKYITKIDYGFDSVTEYEYEFDGEEYLIEQRTISNGKLRSLTTFIYK